MNLPEIMQLIYGRDRFKPSRGAPETVLLIDNVQSFQLPVVELFMGKTGMPSRASP